MGDAEAQTTFETWTHEGAFVHEDEFQIAHEQCVNVQLLAQTVHGNEVSAEADTLELLLN